MAAEVVTIPKKDYELLVKCRRIVESEFEEGFSKEFIRQVKESEKAYKEGKFVRFDNVKEAKAFFDKA